MEEYATPVKLDSTAPPLRNYPGQGLVGGREGDGPEARSGRKGCRATWEGWEDAARRRALGKARESCCLFRCANLLGRRREIFHAFELKVNRAQYFSGKLRTNARLTRCNLARPQSFQIIDETNCEFG